MTGHEWINVKPVIEKLQNCRIFQFVYSCGENEQYFQSAQHTSTCFDRMKKKMKQKETKYYKQIIDCIYGVLIELLSIKWINWEHLFYMCHLLRLNLFHRSHFLLFVLVIILTYCCLWLFPLFFLRFFEQFIAFYMHFTSLRGAISDC